MINTSYFFSIFSRLPMAILAAMAVVLMPASGAAQSNSAESGVSPAEKSTSSAGKAAKSWLQNEMTTSLNLKEPPAQWRDSLMRIPAISEVDTLDVNSVGSENGRRSDGRYRVGLVLSGGGAKGIAHIGVIKALEDNDIPIDCITGTSMGAIVGSLYSCGLSPAQMMELIKSPVFQNCATGTLDPAMTYYFSKPAPTPAWGSVNLSFKDSVHNNISEQLVPSSLINPLPMNIEFLNLFSPTLRNAARISTG